MPEKETSQDLILLIGRLDGKLDMIPETNTSLGQRVAKLETASSRLHGVALALAAFSTYLGKDHLAALFGLGANP